MGLSRAFSCYLVTGDITSSLTELTISDIPDLTVRMSLQEIENASDDDTLKVLQERDDIQFLMAQAGFANEYLTLKSTKYLSCDVTRSMLSALDWIL